MWKVRCDTIAGSDDLAYLPYSEQTPRPRHDLAVCDAFVTEWQASIGYPVWTHWLQAHFLQLVKRLTKPFYCRIVSLRLTGWGTLKEANYSVGEWLKFWVWVHLRVQYHWATITWACVIMGCLPPVLLSYRSIGRESTYLSYSRRWGYSSMQRLTFTLNSVRIWLLIRDSSQMPSTRYWRAPDVIQTVVHNWVSE